MSFEFCDVSLKLLLFDLLPVLAEGFAEAGRVRISFAKSSKASGGSSLKSPYKRSPHVYVECQRTNANQRCAYTSPV